MFFGLTCGRVSTSYINFRKLYSYPSYLKTVARMLMKGQRNYSIVVGATIEAAPLIWECADAVTGSCSVDFELRAFCLCPDYGQYFADYHAFEAATFRRPVIIVDGSCSTGNSLQKVRQLVEANDGRVVGYRLIWNRNPLMINKDTMGAPVVSLINQEIKSFVPEEHPQWGIWPLVTDVGHPEHFPDYRGPTITIL